MNFKLRPYQIDSVNLLRKSIKSGKKHPILGLPTGAGKTVTFSYLIEQALTKGSRVGIVCHRQELIEQAQKTMEAYGLPVDIIHYGMVQTYVRSPQKIPAVDVCVIDECHIGNFRRFIELLPSNTQVIGVTATPIGSSKKNPLNKVFDDVVYPVQIGELIEQGYLSKPIYHLWKCDDSQLSFDSTGEYSASSQAKVFHMEDLMDAVNQRVGKTIIFCSSINQVEQVCESLPDAFMVHSKMSCEHRKSIIQRYKQTPNSIMVNCGILTAGFDEPIIETVIMYRATTSISLWLQICGRGSRVVSGVKDTFYIFDLGGNHARLLPWEANRDWKALFELQGRNLKDKEAPMKKCCECEAIIFASQSICPYCDTKQPTKPKKDLKATEVQVISSFHELPKELQVPFDEMTVKQLIARAAYGSPQLGRPFKQGWIISQIKSRSNSAELIYELAKIKGYKQGWINRQL